MTVDEIIDRVIAVETSRFTHDAEAGDPPTKWGITPTGLRQYQINVLRMSRAATRTPTADEIRALTRAEAVAVYRAEYVDRPGFGHLPDGMARVMVIDWGVHAGQATAARGLQRALGQLLSEPLKVDGRVGPVTLAAVARAKDWPLVHRLAVLRADYNADVVRRSVRKRCAALGVPDLAKTTKLKYTKGWTRRVLEGLR